MRTIAPMTTTAIPPYHGRKLLTARLRFEDISIFSALRPILGLTEGAKQEQKCPTWIDRADPEEPDGAPPLRFERFHGYGARMQITRHDDEGASIDDRAS